MRFFSVPPLWRILLLIVAGVGLIGWTMRSSPLRWRLHPRVTDEIGLLGKTGRIRHEEQLQLLFDESGVDIRFLLVSTTGGEPIERYAVRRARELGVGRDTDRRGLLILYHRAGKEMRIEVGPTLQGVLPDRFIGFVVREHARAFFEGGDPELGLRLIVRLLHWRIREAQLGAEYDPSVEEYVKDVRRLATGGGASGEVGDKTGRRLFVGDRANATDSARFRPQPTVEHAHRAFLEWLALDRQVGNVPLFTSNSQRYLAALPLTRGYKAGWLALEYGKAFSVDQRGDVAMLYFTGTPFVSPHFFRHTSEGWQLDVMGELVNSLEAVGGWYTWILLESDDEYSRTFADRYLPFDDAGFGRYYRVAGGDNRRLTTRSNGPRATAQPTDSEVEHLTVFQAAGRIAAVRDRPSVVVLYNTGLPERLEGLGTLARFCAANGIELLAFDTDYDDERVAALPRFLESKNLDIPARHIYRWRSGLLDSTFGRLGIAIGRTWAPPLIAVRDRTGRVVAQAQGVGDWSTAMPAIRAILE
jgi:uncharacterized protein